MWMWDSKRVYLLVEVTDDKKLTNDSVEVYFDADNSKMEKRGGAAADPTGRIC
ncbi:hypothetical protein DL346_07110 [Paenibacillus montanisoli]|uniref:Carbohydrate-binding domain-containing protein n=2 Tax=Paenibacillus montanisoli TaxID=2081970 RepID=A0A328U8M6_9BACL|nr:hypothetical protein DL346_07110 [Paenibacillus montanisoli]